MAVLKWKTFSVPEWDTFSVAEWELFGSDISISHPLVFNDVYIINGPILEAELVKSTIMSAELIKGFELDR